MAELFYCCGCQLMCDTAVIEKEETLIVKGREITLAVPVRVCAVCGEEILDEKLDAETLRLFYNEYRRLENLLLPDEIKSIRKSTIYRKFHLLNFLVSEKKQ